MQRRTSQSFAQVPVLLAAMVISCAVTASNAQIQRFSRSMGQAMTLPVPPREFQQSLLRAKRAIDEEQYSDAIEALVELLGTPGNEDFFVESEEGQPSRSLKSTARDLLGSLPKAGRDIYELQFGVEAKRLLDQAVEARDIQRVTDVSRRFFHTDAGYDATFLLGQHNFDHRRPLAAAMTLARLSEHAASANRFAADLPLLLAMSWRLAGNAQNATDVLIEFKRQHPDANIRVADKDVPLFAANVDPLVWLDQVVGRLADPQTTAVEQWALFRGDAARNSSLRGGMPLPGLQWRVEVCPESLDDEAKVRTTWKAFLESGKPKIPALSPLVVGDYVLMRTVEGLYGVDVETGKRIWPFPWFVASDTTSLPSADFEQIRPAFHESQRAFELKQRVWEDLTQGQLSSDGDLVFAVYGSKSPAEHQQQLMFGDRRNMVQSGNQLVALELATQGKIRWLLGGADGDLPELKDAFFMGPPLPLDGRLYLVAELKDEIKLLVLDAETGAIVWTQQLGHIDAPYPTALQDRRLIGASPSFADGILVCPTAAGAAVAVDLATRSLVWGYEYRQVFRSAAPNMMNNVESNPRWADGVVAIHQGRVVMTPMEAESLICLDLLTGEPVWSPTSRDDGVFLAGIDHNVIVIVGERSVRGIRLDDGTAAWDEPLVIPGNAMPSGRGFMSGGDYFLPTTADQVVRFRVADGTIVEFVDSEYPLGNLFCYRDKVLSQTPDALYAFYQRERMRELMPQRLAESPDDPRVLEDNARLLVNDGKYDESIQHLRRAIELYDDDSPHKSSAKTLLVRVMLDSLRQDFDKREYRDELERLIDDPRQRIDFYRISAVGLLDRDEKLAAFDVLLQLAELKSLDPPDVDDLAELERVTGEHRVQLDVWLRSQIAKLFSGASDDEQKKMLERITARLDVVKQPPNIEDRTRFVDLFLGFPQALTLLSDLANEQIAAGQFLSAERWLTHLQQTFDGGEAIAASMALANLYRTRMRFDDAHDLFVRMTSDWPDAKFHDGRSGSEIAAAGLEKLRQDGSLGIAGNGLGELSEWPQGRVEISNDLPMTTERNVPSELLSIDLREVHGQWNPNNRLAYDRNRHEVVVLDGHGVTQIGVPVAAPSFARRPPIFQSGHDDSIEAKLYGHLMVVSLGYEILAINLLDDVDGRSQDRILWRADVVPGDERVSTQPIGANNPWAMERLVPVDTNSRRVGRLGPVGATGVCYQKGTELRCVDLMSGRIRWVRKGVRYGCDLFGDEELVFVVPPDSTTATVYAMADGEERGERQVPIEDRRWLSQGRRVLTWDGEHGKSETLTLRMMDAWETRDVWQQSFADLSRGFEIDNDEMVVMQPNGKTTVFGLRDGEIRLQANLLPESQLNHVFAIRSRDQYLFITNRPPIAKRGANRQPVFTQMRNISLGPARQINGRVYAVDRQTSDTVWSVPAEIDGYFLPLAQAVNSPTLLFVRYVSKPQRTAGGRIQPRQHTELLCLDRRDGRLIARDEVRNVKALQRIEVHPDRNQVIVALSDNEGLVLDFTDKPRPPAAPLQNGFVDVQPVNDEIGDDLGNNIPGLNANGQNGPILRPGRVQIQIQIQGQGGDKKEQEEKQP